jgi:hypothetical protein
VFASDSLLLKRSIPIKARLLSTDQLGNVLLVKENNTLLKLNAAGDSIGIFNEIKKGKVTQIDATNPLRILLYFADYNQIVVLNNMLTQKTVLKLNSVGLFNSSCVASSADGSIWVFDPVMASLIKLSEQMEVLQTSNLRNQQENPVRPSCMIEFDRSLFLADTIEGIRKFDLFGFYNTTYHFPTDNLQLFNNYMVYYKRPFLYSYHLTTLREQAIRIPHDEDVLSVRIERKFVYVLRQERLDIYELRT